MKANIKKIISSFLFSGLVGSLSKFKKTNTGKAFILTYHRVLNKSDKEINHTQSGMYVTTESFYKHIQFLKSNFNVLPLDRLVSKIRNAQSVDQCCSITFDDGWIDNYKNAYPVLKELNIPATIFLATDFIGTDRNFWPNELYSILVSNDFKDYKGQDPYLEKFFKEISFYRGDINFLDQAIEILKKWAPFDRQKVLDGMKLHDKSVSMVRALLNWDEVQEMYQSGLITFGAHTVNHVILDQVSLQQAEQEISQSCIDIEARVGIRSNLFAYPNGNFNDDIQLLVANVGFGAAVTTCKGWVTANTNMLSIPRIGMHEDISCTIPLFLARIFLKRF